MEGGDKVELKEITSGKTDTVVARTEPEDVKITVDDSTGKEAEVRLPKDDSSQPIDNKDREGKEDARKTEDKEMKIDEQDAEEDEKKDVEKPLIGEEGTVTIDLGGGDDKLPGEDTPTLPLPDKKKPLPQEDEEDKKEKPPSMFLHPIDTLRHAWRNSKSMPEFFVRAICIMFASLGWVFCVGGVPLLPLVMLIIGSVFIGDCPFEPRIPVYLVVAGLFGLIQHVAALVTKYIPKEKRGILQAQKRRCMCLDSILQTFLFIWFIAGCVWVYSIYEPEYSDRDHPEYCHKTVYLFTFWMFNVSFIILCAIIVFALCVIICVVTQTDRSPEKSAE